LEEEKYVKKQRPDPRKQRVITAIVVGVVLAVMLFVSLRNLYLQNLREEMENHLTQSIIYLETGQNDLAKAEALEAEYLAYRLSDDEYIKIVGQQIYIVESVISGLELFERHNFYAARDAFFSALETSRYIEELNSRFILELIEITEEHILFEEMVNYGEILLEQNHYEYALGIFERALELAVSLSFDYGVRLSQSLIYETEQRIIEAKRAIAREHEALGDLYYESAQFEQAIAEFQNAMDIYREIRDLDAFAEARRKRIAAEQALAAYLAEIQRLEAERLEAERLEAERLETERIEAERLEEEALSEASEQDEQNLDENYEHNRGIHFDLITPIDNQNASPANLIRMGRRPGLNEGWYNGCGWIAAYNALIILGQPVHPAEIVNHFETNRGTVLDGVFGTFPHAIENFLEHSGRNVSHTLFPRSGDIDEAIRSWGIGILAYSHTRAAHFITIRYDRDEGVFIVYNDSFARRRSAALGLENITEIGAAVDSVAALMRETSEILFSFSLITVN